MKTKTGKEQIQRIEESLIKEVFLRSKMSVKEARHIIAGFRSPRDMTRKVSKEEFEWITRRMERSNLLKVTKGYFFIPLSNASMATLIALKLLDARPISLVKMKMEVR